MQGPEGLEPLPASLCLRSTVSTASQLAARHKGSQAVCSGPSVLSLALKQASPGFQPPGWLLPVQIPRTWASSQSHASQGAGWFL